MRKIVAAFCGLMFFYALTGEVLAKTYRVEVVVFGQHASSVENAAQQNSAIDWPEKLSEITTLAVANQDSVVLSPLSALAKVKGILANQKHYPLMFQGAWQQSVTSKQNAQAVHITNSKNNLDGYLRLADDNNALSLSIDLEYLPFATASSNGAASSTLYHLQETRKLPLNEMHYFDHPNFGAIVIVSPL